MGVGDGPTRAPLGAVVRGTVSREGKRLAAARDRCQRRRGRPSMRAHAGGTGTGTGRDRRVRARPRRWASARARGWWRGDSPVRARRTRRWSGGRGSRRRGKRAEPAQPGHGLGDGAAALERLGAGTGPVAGDLAVLGPDACPLSRGGPRTLGGSLALRGGGIGALHGLLLRALTLLVHEPGPKGLPGRELVVRPAAQAQVLHRRLAALRRGLHVVVLEPATRFAPVAVLAHEGALAAVAPPHRALHLGRDVARVGRHVVRARPGPRGGGELAALERGDEGVEGAVEHLGQLARGDLVAEQLLRMAQLVVRGLAHGELERKALRGHWRHLGVRYRGQN